MSSHSQDPKGAKGYDPGLERSRAQDRKKAKGYDAIFGKNLSQNPNLINKFQLFFTSKKFARLVLNIILSLSWITISEFTFGIGAMIWMLRKCSYSIFGPSCPKVDDYSTLWNSDTFFYLFVYGPPLLLTWYLWLKKRAKNK